MTSRFWGASGNGLWPGFGSRPFSPADLFTSTNGGWYDPSDLSSMFQTTDTSTPAAVNSTVGRINDKSGNGNHLTQSTAGARPTLRQSGALYYLEFDGGDFMDSAAFGAAFSQPTAAAFAIYVNAIGAAQHILDGITNRNVLAITAAGNASLWAGSGFADGGLVAAATPTVVNGLFNQNSSKMRVNSSETALSGIGSNTLGEIRIGCFQSGVAHLTGRIYGAIIRNSALTAPEQANVETYLGTKAGIVL